MTVIAEKFFLRRNRAFSISVGIPCRILLSHAGLDHQIIAHKLKKIERWGAKR